MSLSYKKINAINVGELTTEVSIWAAPAQRAFSRQKVLFVFYLMIITSFLVSCGNTTIQKQLSRSWYAEGEQDTSFILYDDGTCEISGEYGTGSWSVVNDNELKLTNYYGKTETAIIKSVDYNKLVLTDGKSEMVFYSSLQERIKSDSAQQGKVKDQKEAIHTDDADSEFHGNIATTREDLIERLKDATGKDDNDIILFDYDDYDNDCLMEAFAFIGNVNKSEYEETGEGEIWFVDEKNCLRIAENDEYWLIDGKTVSKKISFGDRKYIYFNKYFTTGAISLMWTSDGGQPKKCSISGKGEINKFDESGNVVLLISDYDATYDRDLDEWTGHTYKPYYFFYDKDITDFREYGAISIDNETASGLMGYDIISEIKKTDKFIDNIWFRLNDVIEINYHIMDEDYDTYNNVVFSLKDRRFYGNNFGIDGMDEELSTWEESGYYGIYKEAAFPELAVYPDPSNLSMKNGKWLYTERPLEGGTLQETAQTVYVYMKQERWEQIQEILEKFDSESKETITIADEKHPEYTFLFSYMPEAGSWHAYYGEVKGDKRDGKGLLVANSNQGYSDFGLYFGNWSNDSPEGEGKFFNSDDEIWSGRFKDGLFNGVFYVDLVTDRHHMSVNWDTLEPVYDFMDEYVCHPMIVDMGIPKPMRRKDMTDNFLRAGITMLYAKPDGEFFYDDSNGFKLFIVQYSEIPGASAFHVNWFGDVEYLIPYGIPGYKNR